MITPYSTTVRVQRMVSNMWHLIDSRCSARVEDAMPPVVWEKLGVQDSQECWTSTNVLSTEDICEVYIASWNCRWRCYGYDAKWEHVNLLSFLYLCDGTNGCALHAQKMEQMVVHYTSRGPEHAIREQRSSSRHYKLRSCSHSHVCRRAIQRLVLYPSRT